MKVFAFLSLLSGFATARQSMVPWTGYLPARSGARPKPSARRRVLAKMEGAADRLRLRRQRLRDRHHLEKLSDHVLKDMGINRERLLFEASRWDRR